MTTSEYGDYEARVAAFFQKEGLNCLSRQQSDDKDEESSEPVYHSTPCDVCGDRHAGDRVTMSGFNPTTKEIQDCYSVCCDCEYYIAWGQLDDMTMMEMIGTEVA